MPPDDLPESIAEGDVLNLGNMAVLPPYYVAGPGSVVNVGEGVLSGQRIEANDSQVNWNGGSGAFQLIANNTDVDFSSGTLPVFTLSGGRLTVTGGIAGQRGFRQGSFGSEESVSQINLLGGSMGFLNAPYFTSIQVNGGRLASVNTGPTSDLTLSAGRIGDRLVANGPVEISGGIVDHLIPSFRSATVVISGGVIKRLSTSTSRPEIFGNEFLLDGNPIPELATSDTATVHGSLSGILADGTPFNFPRTSSVVLNKTELPELRPPLVASRDEVGDAIRRGEELTVDAAIPDNFYAVQNTKIEVVSGGTVGNGLLLWGSQINVLDGIVGHELQIERGSIAQIRGGTFGDGVSIDDESSVVLFGNDFMLNGAPVEEELWNDGVYTVPPSRGVLTGILQDGSPFAVDDATGIALNRVEIPNAQPMALVASTDSVGFGLRSNQTLRVDAGSALSPHFTAGRGSEVIIEEGSRVGENFEAFGSNVEVRGGFVGRELEAFADTNLSIHGGIVESLVAREGATVEITGGNIGELFVRGGIASVSGGAIGKRLRVAAGSELHLLGSEFLFDGLPIEDLTSPGASVLFTSRDRIKGLSGHLDDGALFDFSTSDREKALGYSYMSADATIRLTLTRLRLDCDRDDEVSASDLDCFGVSGEVDQLADTLHQLGTLLGDLNLDGKVGFEDFLVFSANFGRGDATYLQGDLNSSQSVDFADFLLFQSNFGTAVAAVSAPEPSSLTPVMFATIVISSVLRRYRQTKNTPTTVETKTKE